MAIKLGSTECKVAPTLQAAWDYLSNKNVTAQIVPTELGYVIVEHALPGTQTRRTTPKECSRVQANAKQIFCPELNTTFANLREAAEKTGAAYQNISAVLHGRLQHTKKLTFIYVSELQRTQISDQEEEY